MEKRLDKDRIVLKTGEVQCNNRNLYKYRWTDPDGKRHTIYASTLKELRAKEELIALDRLEGIDSAGMYKSLNEMFELWCELKRGLKRNTFANYKYMYNTYVKPSKFGHMIISKVKKSDVKAFYNHLKDDNHLKNSTIDGIHTVIHQVLQLAVEDDFLRNNPSDNVLREFKRAHNCDSERRMALTAPEEKLFLDYLRSTPQVRHWYPLFLIMVKTGMRVGEATGLRWQDIDLDNGIIDVNHTLVYYAHELKNGCYFGINSTKTVAGTRKIPMSKEVKDAFLEELEFQEQTGLQCKATVDGYTNFIFVNRFGECQHNGTLNKALVRIIRDCNDAVLDKGEDNPVLLPHFSCHSLRHTFTTRMVEAGLNPKFIQDVLGHADITTTLNIYADCTKQLKTESMKQLEAYYSSVDLVDHVDQFVDQQAQDLCRVAKSSIN